MTTWSMQERRKKIIYHFEKGGKQKKNLRNSRLIITIRAKERLKLDLFFFSRQLLTLSPDFKRAELFLMSGLRTRTITPNPKVGDDEEETENRERKKLVLKSDTQSSHCRI